MFNYIVEDPFYSAPYGGIITVKDDGSIIDVNNKVVGGLNSDELLETLYSEWLYYNGLTESDLIF